MCGAVNAIEGVPVKIERLLVVFSFILPIASMACTFDTDCNPSSSCKKAPGALYGVCYGGIAPGNKNDKEPVKAPLDINRTYGNTCSFDTECGPSSVCSKPTGAISGVCLKKN